MQKIFLFVSYVEPEHLNVVCHPKRATYLSLNKYSLLVTQKGQSCLCLNMDCLSVPLKKGNILFVHQLILPACHSKRATTLSLNNGYLLVVQPVCQTVKATCLKLITIMSKTKENSISILSSLFLIKSDVHNCMQ